MTISMKSVGNAWILVLLSLLVAVSSSAEQRTSSKEAQNKGFRISKVKVDQLACFLMEVAGLAADQDRREIHETVQGFTNQMSMVNLGASEMQRMRSWLRIHRTPQTDTLEKADYLLVTLGDTNALARVLTTLGSGPLLDRLGIPDRLSKTEQPAVIVALSKELLAEESINPDPGSLPEVRMEPPSVIATGVIIGVLVSSPSFTDAVQLWANGLQQLTLEKRRDLLRRWWKKNEQYFAIGEYALVVPLSEAESSIMREDYLPKRRPIRKIE